MKNLEDLNIKTDDLTFEPITGVDIIMKNSAQVRLTTPLSVKDFIEIWNTWKRKVRITTGKESFASINKRHVISYHIYPLQK